MATKGPGVVVTFYSYKGGTGRTMALANLAWVLASNDQKVLLIDWDLEAPGLHRYFKPFLIDPELQSTPGLIDFVWDVAKEKMTLPPTETKSSSPAFRSLEDYVVGLDWDFDGTGSIALVPAGRQDEIYAQRVNTFGWDNFYQRLGGGKVLQAAIDDLRSDYDYILVDSRTGVSDTSGICTVQLPDIIVICFTLNHQSMRGAASVAASIQAQRGISLPIFPVPTRLENAETDKLDEALTFARKMFAPFTHHILARQSVSDGNTNYWEDVQTPYRTFYAFAEVPAAFKDRPGSRDTILASTERLASWLTAGEVTALQPTEESRRKAVVDAYAFDAKTDRLPGQRFDKDGARIGIQRQIVKEVLHNVQRYVVMAIICLLLVLLGTAIWFLQATKSTIVVLQADAQRNHDLSQANLQNAQQLLATTKSQLSTTQAQLDQQIAIVNKLTGTAQTSAVFATAAQALTMKECSTKYEAAKAANTLNRMGWNDFRKAQCGADATPAAAPAPAAPAPAAPAPAAPAPTAPAPTAPAPAAPAPAAPAPAAPAPAAPAPAALAPTAPAPAAPAPAAPAPTAPAPAAPAPAAPAPTAPAPTAPAPAAPAPAAPAPTALAPTAPAPAAPAPAAPAPTTTTTDAKSKPTMVPATANSGNAVFPSAISPKYSTESAGQQRMHTCLDQYNANKANNGNGGLKWIQKGGGYYSECNKRLKG